MILAPRFSNSGAMPAIAPSSVVQTGVKFFGCEKRTAHPSPIQSWKWMVPFVVSAVKSGAVSLMRRLMVVSFYPVGLSIRAHAVAGEDDRYDIRSDRGCHSPKKYYSGMIFSSEIPFGRRQRT